METRLVIRGMLSKGLVWEGSFYHLVSSLVYFFIVLIFIVVF